MLEQEEYNGRKWNGCMLIESHNVDSASQNIHSSEIVAIVKRSDRQIATITSDFDASVRQWIKLKALYTHHESGYTEEENGPNVNR